MKKLSVPLFLLVLLFALKSYAGTSSVNFFNHALYAGALGGFGSTTWIGLVPSDQNQNLALNMSTPIHVKEGGQVWGLLAGYEFTPYFALEANYMHYPDATITFNEFSLFSFNNNGLGYFKTSTETLSLNGKIMLIIPSTKMRVFSSAGVANVHRQDMIVDDWRASPTFGVGLNYHISEHVMGELGGNYTAGFGESQLIPTETYFPFLYSVSLRLAYCI